MTRIIATSVLALALTAGAATAETAVEEAQARLDALLAQDRVAERQTRPAARPGIFRRVFGRDVILSAADTGPVTGRRDAGPGAVGFDHPGRDR